MHPKTRYNIRKAEKNDIKIRIFEKPTKKINTFFNIIKKSAEKNNFFIYPKSYYCKIFEESEKRNSSFLAIAYYKRKPVAVNFVLLSEKTASFLFSGVLEEGRNLRSSYLLRWEAIKRSKKLKMTKANFGAVTKKENGDWQGFSKFKQGFGGYYVSYPFFDLIGKSLFYYLYLLQRYFKNKHFLNSIKKKVGIT